MGYYSNVLLWGGGEVNAGMLFQRGMQEYSSMGMYLHTVTGISLDLISLGNHRANRSKYLCTMPPRSKKKTNLETFFCFLGQPSLNAIEQPSP